MFKYIVNMILKVTRSIHDLFFPSAIQTIENDIEKTLIENSNVSSRDPV